MYSNIKYAIAKYLFCANTLNIICDLERGKKKHVSGCHGRVKHWCNLFGLMWPKVNKRVTAAQALIWYLIKDLHQIFKKEKRLTRRWGHVISSASFPSIMFPQLLDLYCTAGLPPKTRGIPSTSWHEGAQTPKYWVLLMCVKDAVSHLSLLSVLFPQSEQPSPASSSSSSGFGPTHHKRQGTCVN